MTTTMTKMTTNDTKPPTAIDAAPELGERVRRSRHDGRGRPRPAVLPEGARARQDGLKISKLR